jgi:hypothetical protein
MLPALFSMTWIYNHMIQIIQATDIYFKIKGAVTTTNYSYSVFLVYPISNTLII